MGYITQFLDFYETELLAQYTYTAAETDAIFKDMFVYLAGELDKELKFPEKIQ